MQFPLSPPPLPSPPQRRDFPHLQFSLNGGVQSAAEARSAILYEGPWPTPGHVESRLKLLLPSPQENGAAAAEAGAAPQQTPRGTTSQEGEGLQQACVTMVASSVAGCGIGGDCVDDGDRLQQHQGEGVSGEAGTAGMAEAAVAESVPPIVSHAPISADDGLIEGVMTHDRSRRVQRPLGMPGGRRPPGVWREEQRVQQPERGEEQGNARSSGAW